jgi:hypothetical protein
VARTPPTATANPPLQYAAWKQGLTLVHFPAQLEQCLTHKSTLHTLNTPLTRAAQPLRAPPILYKALKLS